jgi:hypothetical protein
MSWTLFWDMHSGGGTKEPPYEKIYIEAPEKEAVIIFYNRFSHNPHRVTCACCGPDYSISEDESLEEKSSYHRRPKDFRFNDNLDEADLQPIDEYIACEDVLVIRSDEIKPEERIGDIPTQGYVWMD